MNLKKGSPEAKKFMAKLRAKKKKSIGISRSQKQYNKEVDLYKYFVIDIQANRVISGWEYLEDAKDSVNDYFTKSNFKIVPKSKLKTLNLSNSIEDFKNENSRVIQRFLPDRKGIEINGWAKGNTRMIEMDEKPFKKLKNVRVKRTKDGVFNKFKVIPNMEQFIKDKRKSLSGTKIKVSEDILRFLESEGKNSKGYTYRAKLLWGQEIVLKEKNGNPIEKFVIGDYDEAVYIAKELNKGQDYTNVKTKKIKK